MSIGERFQQIRDLHVRWGVGRACAAAGLRLVRRWGMLSEVFVCENRPLDADAEAPEGVEVREPTRAELDRAADRMSDQLSPAFIARAYERGDFCIGAFADGALVAFTWVSKGSAPATPDLDVTVAPPDHYAYKTYVLAAWRGRRLAKCLSRHAAARSLALGAPQSVSYVEWRNFSSRTYSARAGKRRIGYAGYVRLLGRVVPFHSGGVKARGFRFVPARLARDGPPCEPSHEAWAGASTLLDHERAAGADLRRSGPRTGSANEPAAERLSRPQREPPD